MPIADDWTVDFIDKKVSHVQFKDEITGSDSSVAEVGTVKCAADVGGSLNNKYFILYSATDATKYHVWYNVNSGGTDPAPAGSTAIVVAISTNATAAAVATATSSAINTLAGTDFTAAVNSDTITVTITNDAKGSATDVADFNTSTFVFNKEVATVLCPAGSTFTTTGAGDYFILYSANDTTKYHVWYNVDDGTPNTDPAPEGSVGVEVIVLAADTAAEVATKTQAAIDALGDFVATVDTATVTITNAAAGPSTNVADGVSSGCTFTTITNPIKGIGKTVWSVNALYSLLQDVFDELGSMDDKVPMDAQTPTEYRFINEWFIDEVSIKYLRGGAIKTSGWARVPGTTTGIVQVIYSGSTAPVATDIGKVITHQTDADTGSLLFADISTARKRLWIRPASSASANNFDSSSGNLDITDGTQDIVQSAAASSGENTWANMFTLGTIEPNTAIYVVQDSAKVSAWWPVGQIDVLLRVLEAGSYVGANSGDIRDIFIGAREYSKLYDHFISSDIDGGRNPVPLATAADLNNTTGQYQIVVTNASGAIAAGETFTANATSNKEGTITSVSGTAPDLTIRYYLSGTALTAFVNTDACTASSGKTFTVASLSNVVADYGTGGTGITFTFAYTTKNLNNGAGAKPYNVVIDLKSTKTVAQMYEWLKFVARRGATNSPQLQTGDGTIAVPNFANIDGEQYIKLLAGTLAVDNFTPVKASPFGTFAGGKFFGAQGVWLDNVPTADIQNFQLIDSNGATQVPPNTVSVTVSNLRQSDVTGVFVLTAVGGTINKAKFNMTDQAAGLNTITVDAIDAETPQTGVIRVVDVSDSLKAEQQYQYRSWSGVEFALNRFPLAGGNSTVTTGGSTTTFTDSAANFVTAKIRAGDIVTNVTDGSVATVVSVNTPGTQITTTGLTGGDDNTFTASDAYNITTLTNRAYVDADPGPTDTAYAPIINAMGVYYNASATNFSAGTGADDDNPASMSNTLIKGAGGDIPVLVRVRRGSSGLQNKILPFEIAQSVTQSGMSQAAIRTLDSIVT